MTERPTPSPDLPAGELLDDEALVRRVVAGERALYAELLRRHNRRVYRVARAIVRDDAEAEDVLQDAYVRAYAHLAEFEGRSAWVTWLTRIAVHEALARRRRREREVLEDAMTLDHREAPASPERDVAARELARLLEASVDELPDGFREVFVLRDVEGLGVRETALGLDLKEETVKTRLFRARRLLREALDARLGESAREVYGFHAVRCERVVQAVMSRLAAGAGR